METQNQRNRDTLYEHGDNFSEEEVGMDERMELSELVEGLRLELEKARQKGVGSDVRFEVGPVELEVTLSVAKKTTGEGGVKLWVVNAQANRELSSAHTQRIKLVLEPHSVREGSDASSNQSPLMVSGDILPRER